MHNKNCWYDLSDDFDSQIINNRTVYNFEANGRQVNVITNPDWRPDTKLPRYIEVELYQTAGNKTDFRIIDENKPNIHYNRATNNPSVAIAKDEKNQRFVSDPNKKVVAPDADKYKWIDKHRHPDPNVQSSFGTSKPITNSTYFTTQTEWQAPGKGTGLKYTVYQQDIDLNARPFISDGDMRTNAELMQKGNAPYILKNGKYEQVQLHHSQQDGRGSLFELTETSHQTNHKSGGKALHPYGQNQHSDFPVERDIFDKDRAQYWKDRLEKLRR